MSSTGSISLLLTIIALSLLLLSVSSRARRKGSARILEYGKTMKGGAIFLMVFAAAITMAAAQVPDQDRWRAFLVAIAMWLGAIYLTLESFIVKISFDAKGIRTRSPWRRSRFIPWAEITGTHHSILHGRVIQTRTLGSVRLNPYLSGSQTLLDRVKNVLARQTPTRPNELP